MPLSNDTITRRIIEMSDDIEQQLLERIKSSPYYAIQIDESTDVSNIALLLVFVRYCADCGEFIKIKYLPST